MIDAGESLDRGTTADLLEATPDWAMLAISFALIAGWLSWIGVTAYRLVAGL
jgi:hypothetical protein